MGGILMSKSGRFWLNFLCVLLFSTALCATDTLTMKDGTQHTGTLVSMGATTVTFREGKTLHHYRRSDVQSLQLGTAAEQPALTTRSHQTAALPKNFTLPTGTEIAVMTDQPIDSS